MRTQRCLAGVLLILCVLLGSAYAGPVSRIVVFGDSLSDNGNLFALVGYPPAPYYSGRFSNGPVAVEQLAPMLGVSLTDFAWGGSTTGFGNYIDGGDVDTMLFLPGMTTVFNTVFPATPVDPDALYIVWGGPNDFWTITDPAQVPAAIGKAVTNILTMVGTLQSLGATRILVPGMPDLGRTPEFLAYGPMVSYFFSQISVNFNQALKASLPPGVHYFDQFALLTDIIDHPAHYGLANVTDRLLYSPGTDPATYLFFDGVHPTTAGHALIADALYRSVAPTVIIGGCNSGAPNPLFSSGATLSDLIAQAFYGATNHGQFVSEVASITNALVKSGAMSGSQKGAIQACAGKTAVP